MPRQAGREGAGGPTPVAQFRFTVEVPNPSGEGFHLHNLAIAEILYGARNAYLATVGVDWAAMIAGGTNLVIRQVTIDFEAEVGEGVPLRSGVRAASRSNRTLTLEEVVWAPGTGLVVARARSLHVSVRLDPPGAVELPADLWARIEQFEAGNS